MPSSTRENILHKISAGKREMGDNSFLRDFRARMLSCRWTISRSMILRISSNESPADSEHEVLVSPKEKTLEFLISNFKIGKRNL